MRDPGTCPRVCVARIWVLSERIQARRSGTQPDVSCRVTEWRPRDGHERGLRCLRPRQHPANRSGPHAAGRAVLESCDGLPWVDPRRRVQDRARPTRAGRGRRGRRMARVAASLRAVRGLNDRCQPAAAPPRERTKRRTTDTTATMIVPATKPTTRSTSVGPSAESALATPGCAPTQATNASAW